MFFSALFSFAATNYVYTNLSIQYFIAKAMNAPADEEEAAEEEAVEEAVAEEEVFFWTIFRLWFWVTDAIVPLKPDYPLSVGRAGENGKRARILIRPYSG